jgi:hypothetical protein
LIGRGCIVMHGSQAAAAAAAPSSSFSLAPYSTTRSSRHWARLRSRCVWECVCVCAGGGGMVVGKNGGGALCVCMFSCFLATPPHLHAPFASTPQHPPLCKPSTPFAGGQALRAERHPPDLPCVHQPHRPERVGPGPGPVGLRSHLQPQGRTVSVKRVCASVLLTEGLRDASLHACMHARARACVCVCVLCVFMLLERKSCLKHLV